MALYGSLATMPLPDLLAWAATRRVSGVLRIEHDGSTTGIEWHEGGITCCSSDDPPTLLGQFLIFRGVISDEQLRQGMEQQKRSGRSLRDFLTDNGILAKEELTMEVATKAEETILGLFELRRGAFGFLEDHTLDSSSAVKLDVEVDDLLMRAEQRREIAARAAEVLGPADSVPARTEENPSERLRYDLPCQRVYDAVDGQATIAEIVLRTHGTGSRVVASLLKLHDEGLIEVVSQGSPAPREIDEVADRRAADVELRRLMDATLLTDDRDRPWCEIEPDRIPVLNRPRDEIAREGITPVEGFLLDLTDGAWDVQSMTWIAPIRPTDVQHTLLRMQERGLIRLSDPA